MVTHQWHWADYFGILPAPPSLRLTSDKSFIPVIDTQANHSFININTDKLLEPGK